MRIIGLLILAIFVGVLVLLLWDNWQNDGFRKFVIDHFPAVIGLPAAGIFSFIVVGIFQVAAGSMVLKFWHMEFRGAAGPIIMWIFCFVVIATAIKLLY